MSDSHKSDGPALVALGLILLSFVLVAPLPLLERATQEAGKQIAQSANGEEKDEQLPKQQEIEGWRLLDPYAQWIMATFAAFATGASVVGIVLLRRTFEETKRTADAAEETVRATLKIGSLEKRAYLTCSSVEQEPGAPGRFRISLSNIGVTPAMNFSIQLEYFGRDREPMVIDHHINGLVNDTIPAGETVRISYGIDARNWDNPHIYGETVLLYKYSDVFGTTYVRKVAFSYATRINDSGESAKREDET